MTRTRGNRLVVQPGDGRCHRQARGGTKMLRDTTQQQGAERSEVIATLASLVFAVSPAPTSLACCLGSVALG